VRRFYAEVGAAVARLHSVEAPALTNRVDQPGAATHDRWIDLVVSEVDRRVGDHPDAEVRRAAERVLMLADAVDAEVRPALIHKDLHPGNLLAQDPTR
jgi:Ser/Thr protein kinase RdoA (MazF antagonist)